MKKEKNSTIRAKESTKDKLTNLDFAKKNMSYDDIVNELLKRYKKRGR